MPAYSDPSHATIYQITQTLAREGIGCLLWGEHLLRTYACTISATDYKFILEDHQIMAAFTILLKEGYQKCPGEFPCALHSLNDTIARSQQHYSYWHPFPSKHLHIHAGSSYPYPTVIALYRKSHYIPTTIVSKLEPPDVLPSQAGRITSIGRYVYAHEVGPHPTPSRGGRFPAHLNAVLIPSPMYLVEMLILLGIRDCRFPGARSLWTRWLMHLREAFIEHGRGLVPWDEKAFLPEVLRPVWQEAIDGEISRFQEPVMGVWRDLTWTLAGVDVEKVRKKGGHWGFEEREICR